MKKCASKKAKQGGSKARKPSQACRERPFQTEEGQETGAAATAAAAGGVGCKQCCAATSVGPLPRDVRKRKFSWTAHNAAPKTRKTSRKKQRPPATSVAETDGEAEAVPALWLTTWRPRSLEGVRGSSREREREKKGRERAGETEETAKLWMEHLLPTSSPRTSCHPQPFHLESHAGLNPPFSNWHLQATRSEQEGEA